MTEPYRSVLLDLYDTVAWTEWHTWQQALADALGVTSAEVGHAFDLTRPARSVGAYPDGRADLAVVIEATGVEVSRDRLAELHALERAIVQERLHLYEDSLPVVRELRSRGVKTALISNCSHDTRPAVDAFGLEHEFDAVILSFEVGLRKPQPGIYREALDRIGAGAEGAVFIDDQPPYCDGAATVGIETFLISRRQRSLIEVPTSSNGHRTITDLTPLLQV